MNVENLRNQYLAMVPVNNIVWINPSKDKSAQKVRFCQIIYCKLLAS